MEKLKLIITREYDADPSSYGTNDPHAMAAIDRENLTNDPGLAIEMILGESIDVKVEPA